MAKHNKKSASGKDIQPDNTDKWWIRGTAETADFFNVTAQTLSDWEKRGAPKEGYGSWDIKKLIEWKHGGKTEQSAEARKLKADADYREAKAEQEKIKLAIEQGRYISADKVTADLKRLFTVIKRSLLAIGHDLATEVSTFDPDVALAAKKVIDNATYEALKQLSEFGEYKQRK